MVSYYGARSKRKKPWRVGVSAAACRAVREVYKPGLTETQIAIRALRRLAEQKQMTERQRDIWWRKVLDAVSACAPGRS